MMEWQAKREPISQIHPSISTQQQRRWRIPIKTLSLSHIPFLCIIYHHQILKKPFQLAEKSLTMTMIQVSGSTKIEQICIYAKAISIDDAESASLSDIIPQYREAETALEAKARLLRPRPTTTSLIYLSLNSILLMVPLLNEWLKYYPFYLCPNKFGASNLEQRNFFQEQIPLRGRKVFLSPALSIEKLGEKS